MEPRAHFVLDAIGRFKPLDTVAKPLKKAVDATVKRGPIKDVLTGTWLGHPLHPVLTDIPIGAWTSSWILDVVGGERARPAADTLLGVAIASSLPTAAAGLADWTDTWGKTQRIGVAHATGNVAALALFSASLAARMRGRRLRGFVLSTLGIGAASVSAYLGGHLT